MVLWLQAHGNPLFDAAALLLSFTGSTAFYVLLVPLVYWALDRRLGIRLLFAVLAATTVTDALKELLRTPRPYVVAPDRVVLLAEQTGYGVPSGHVVISLVVWGYVAVWLRRRSLAWGVAAYVVVMAWSRMYAGVHYPQDVAVGALVGLAVLWLCARLADPLAAWWGRAARWAQALAVVLGSALVLLLRGSDPFDLILGGLLLGSGLGHAWERRALRFAVAGSPARRALRVVLGLALAALVFLALLVLLAGRGPAWLGFALPALAAGAVLTAGGPWLFVRLRLAGKRQD